MDLVFTSRLTGNVTIENSKINAKHVGVQMCAGSLTVTGDQTAITTTGTKQQKTEGDGPIVDGAAISIVKRDGYKDLGKVEIRAGAFKSAQADAVKAYTFNNTDKTEGAWDEANTVVKISRRPVLQRSHCLSGRGKDGISHHAG